MYNNTPVNDRQEILRNFPSLIFKHSDIFFIIGTPEYQRQFMDQTLALTRPDYIPLLREYKKTLAQKTAALKMRRHDIISVYNDHLAATGAPIMRARAEIIDFFNARVGEFFSRVFFGDGEKEKEAETAPKSTDSAHAAQAVEVRYEPSWENAEQTDIQEKLARQGEKEKQLLFCLSGPHKDKASFFLHGHAFKDTASTGQVRLLSLIIRALQAEYFYQKTGTHMVYLFDDVLLELDAPKRARFLQALPEGAQNFFTFLPDETLPPEFCAGAAVYRVTNGTITEEREESGAAS